MRIKIGLFILVLTLSISVFCQNTQKTRYERIKKSTVEILIDNKSCGSGFIIDNSGLIGTCWHVVFNKNIKIDKNSGKILSKIEIVIYNGKKYNASINRVLGRDKDLLIQAEVYDFCILSTKSIDIDSDSIIAIGNYSKAEVGSEILLCGYPFGVNIPIITRGYISTIWTNSIKYVNDSQKTDTLIFQRNSAFLDITLNSGNSGGPVVLVGENPSYDLIIGIATFNLNPYGKYSESFEKSFENKQIISGTLDVAKSFKLISDMLKSNSLGVGGLISIEHINKLVGK